MNDHESSYEKRARIIRNRWIVGVGGFFALLTLFLSWYTVKSGNVAVERTLGRVDHTEVSPGLRIKMPYLTRAFEFSTKEIAVDFNDLQPKAGDNLTLEELDLTIYYRVVPASVSDLMVKYAGVEEENDDGALMPGYGLVRRQARSAIYEQVSKIDSLELHKSRDILQGAVLDDLRARLDEADEDVFTVTRVVVRKLNTDASIEESIRLAVRAEKELEAKKIEVEIAKQDALIKVEESHGLAQANLIINKTLSAEYLQYMVNKALQKFADNGAGVLVIPANMQGFDLILDSDTLRRASDHPTVLPDSEDTGLPGG